jgi:hypothetical protein
MVAISVCGNVDYLPSAYRLRGKPGPELFISRNFNLISFEDSILKLHPLIVLVLIRVSRLLSPSTYSPSLQIVFKLPWFIHDVGSGLQRV